MTQIARLIVGFVGLGFVGLCAYAYNSIGWQGLTACWRNLGGWLRCPMCWSARCA